MVYALVIHDSECGELAIKPVEAENLFPALDKAEWLLELHSAHHVHVYNRFGHLAATVFKDGRVVSSKETKK